MSLIICNLRRRAGSSGGAHVRVRYGLRVCLQAPVEVRRRAPHLLQTAHSHRQLTEERLPQTRLQVQIQVHLTMYFTLAIVTLAYCR